MKWENERKRGSERRKTGGSSHAGQTLESLPSETKGGRFQLSCKLRELYLTYHHKYPYRDSHLVMNLVSIVQVFVTYLLVHLL